MSGPDDARLELRWPGKRGAAEPGPGLTLELEQQVGGADDTANLLICADNLLAMDALLATHAGAIDLIYLDPPFATGHDFARVSFSESHDELRSHAYHDRWPGGLAGFLRMLEPRLRLAHQLLAPQGSLYLHVDPTVGHYAKLVLDEIFGPACFQREIVWRIGWLSGFKTRANNWIRNHDLIFFYSKDPARFTFNKQYVPHPEGYKRRDGQPPRGRGVPMEDVWNANSAEFALRGKDSLDSIQIKSFSREKTGWATQKNTSLLRRIVAASSDPGDLVADFFCGSGTTLVAAAELGRRFIGCDCALPAIELAHARLMGQVPKDMSERPPRFDRLGLGLGERRRWLADGGQPEHITRLLRHHGAEPLTDADRGDEPESHTAARSSEPESHTAARPSEPEQPTAARPSEPEQHTAARPSEPEQHTAARPSEPEPHTATQPSELNPHKAAAPSEPDPRTVPRPDPILHGRRGELGVHIGPWDAPVTRADIHAALAEAARRGLTGLDVLAWRWGFPAGEDLSHGTGIALTCLQIRRELLDDRSRDGAALGERPAFALEWTAVPDHPHAVQVALRGACLRRPERLEPGLRAAFADWRELVDSWSVEFAATPGPFRPDQRWHRTRSAPTLTLQSAPHRYPDPGPHAARVVLVDRLGAAHTCEFSLRWRDGQFVAAPADPT